MQFRHGDVGLTRIESLPNNAKLLKNRKQVAFGEATGHSHRIKHGDIYETNDNVLYLSIATLDAITHEEHEEKILDPGVYRIGIKRQYLPSSGWTKVID